MYMSSSNSLQRYMECCYSKWYVLLVVHFPDGCKCISHGFIQPSIHFLLFPPVQGEVMKPKSCAAAHADNRERCSQGNSASQAGPQLKVWRGNIIATDVAGVYGSIFSLNACPSSRLCGYLKFWRFCTHSKKLTVTPPPLV